MKRIRNIFYGASLLLALNLFASCAAEVVATYPNDVVVAPGPPPFIGAIWIGGEYKWVGGRYVLQGGHWEHPHQGRNYVAGHWDHVQGGYRWRHGYWK